MIESLLDALEDEARWFGMSTAREGICWISANSSEGCVGYEKVFVVASLHEGVDNGVSSYPYTYIYFLNCLLLMSMPDHLDGTGNLQVRA